MCLLTYEGLCLFHKGWKLQGCNPDLEWSLKLGILWRTESYHTLTRIILPNYSTYTQIPVINLVWGIKKYEQIQFETDNKCCMFGLFRQVNYHCHTQLCWRRGSTQNVGQIKGNTHWKILSLISDMEYSNYVNHVSLYLK